MQICIHGETLSLARTETCAFPLLPRNAPDDLPPDCLRTSNMGPCMSAPSASAPGPYAMNSPDSLAAVSSKAALDTNGNKPYSRLVQLRGGSHTLAEKFGLAPGQNAFKYVDKAECEVSRDAKPLHGAEVDVSGGELQLWYCQGAPIAMPVARVGVGRQ